MVPTPRMRAALRKLAAGDELHPDHPPPPDGIGRPTKQRLAKHGLARYTGTPGDWDGPMQITSDGIEAIK